MSSVLSKYSQQDPAWKSVMIGLSSHKFGISGCSLNSVSLPVSGYNHIAAWYVHK